MQYLLVLFWVFGQKTYFWGNRIEKQFVN